MKRIFTRPDSRFLWGCSFTCALLAILAGVLWNEAVLDKTSPIGNMKGAVESIVKRDDGSRLMIIRWTGVRQRYCSGSSQRWLLDGYPNANGYVQQLPPLPFPPRPEEMIGQDVEYRLAVDIPASFPPHRGVYQAVSTYQCNWVQAQFPILNLVVPLPPIPFDLTGEVK